MELKGLTVLSLVLFLSLYSRSTMIDLVLVLDLLVLAAAAAVVADVI
jgi:hypothetical protein